MDPYDLDPHDFVLPFTDFQGDEASEDRPFSEFLKPNLDGRYQLNDAVLFDTEYINPAMLEARDPAAMNDFTIDHSLPAMQYTQNELSPYHVEWQSPTMEFEEQNKKFQTQRQGVLEGAFPNALDTSAHRDMDVDWLRTLQGGLETSDHIANQITGSLAFSQRESHEASFFFKLTLTGRSANSSLTTYTSSAINAL
jgi:hypothetical protein